MVDESGNFDSHLAAAAGQDLGLLAELRACFVDSLTQHVDLLGRARCDANWIMAALRLKGLGATFHSSELIDLAGEAVDGAPGDPVVLRKLGRFRDQFTTSH
ncbi:conserved hypothetical protein [Altererythrobacter sp. B11]|uniref:Hpt domain-containing protein n=1 Tax=Altererythrobacter sp. B11 TaxID=2060312 RepID=UPI000DC73397|nr:Hpt domain-containing protein [Altererythrobacter sp. B11]BBC73023.1 conserved hypothetical protein [Altererythrobacter sp. B11]